MSVLITGAGLVGSQVALHEIADGRRPLLFDIAPDLAALGRVLDLEKCTVVQGDVRSIAELTDVVRTHEVTHIIHTAANPGLTPGAERYPYRAVEINILGTANVLEVARIMGVQRVVLCSTSSMYFSMVGGEDGGAEGHEEAYPRPDTVYATTKQANEGLAGNYRKIFGLDVVVVRLAGVFGPWPGGGGMGTAMLRGLIEDALDGRPVVVPRMEIDWIFSTDAADGICRACHVQATESWVINLSNGELTTAQDLVEIVRELVPGADAKAGAEMAGTAFRERSPSSLTRARRVLGFEPQYDMRAGMRAFYDAIVALRQRAVAG
jgi:nucleoside-diphosphate-sugar epimerase